MNAPTLADVEAGRAKRYWLDGPIGPGKWWGVGDYAKGGIEWHFDTREEAETHLAELRASEAP